ncbi:PKD domain protein [compost metagenome]
MKKIRLVLLFLLMYITGSAQLCEGFESSAAPVAPAVGSFATWTLSSGTWTIINPKGAKAWVRGTTPLAPARSGTYSAYMDREALAAPNIPEDWLVTPAINLAGITNPQLKFFSRKGLSGNTGTTYKVMISTTSASNISTFTEVKNWTDMSLTYNEILVDLPVSTGTIYLAFVMIGNDMNRWIIDDVSVESKCIQPNALSVTDTTLNSATLNWANPGSATQFEVEYMLDTVNPTGTGTIVNQNSYNTGAVLQPNTMYQFYVRSKCTGCADSFGPWVGPHFFDTFKTGEVCALPIIIPPTLPFIKTGQTVIGNRGYSGDPGTGCGFGTAGFLNQNRTVYSYKPPTGTTSINISVVNDSDDADAQKYTGVFVYNSCANFGVNCMAANADSESLQKDILNLAVTPGVTYYIVVTSIFPNYSIAITKNNCTSNIAASFSIQSDCTPTGVFTAKATITDMGGATSLEATPIVNGALQTGQKITITTPGQYTFGTSIPYTHTQNVRILLQSIQNNNCYVLSGILSKKYCPPANDGCANAVVLPTNINGLCNPVSGSLMGATASPVSNSCGENGTADVWFQFTAVATEHFISIGGVSPKLDLNHAVYEGNSCVSLTQLYCESSNQSTATNLIVGQVYRIKVFSATASPPDQSTFTICTSAFPYTCMDNNPSAATVKGLFIDLMNHLLSIDLPLPNASTGYTCPQLLALAPYITTSLPPKIYSFSRSNGQLAFSFSSSGGASVTLKGIPAGQSITNIKFFSYLTPTAGATMAVSYGSGDIVNAGNTAKLIDFCPEDPPCNPVVGSIKITPGLSCVVVNQPYGFSLVTQATNIISYSWVFYDSDSNIVGTSSLASPVMKFTLQDEYRIELIVNTPDGCDTVIKKMFYVMSDCSSFCTETNPQSTVIKKLYIDLLNHLLTTYGSGGNVANIATGFNCPQLVALAPYITDANPLIYNLNYVSATKTLKFSFANHGVGSFDVTVINNGIINDILLIEFNSPTVAKTCITQYVNGVVDYNGTHTVSHVNFCSGACAPLIGKINLDTGISCVVLNKPTLFNFQTTSSAVTTYAWTFYAVNSTTTVLTTSVLSHASYTYTAAGSYQVKLVVNYGNGCTATFWKSITVGTTCITCTETNPKSADVKELYLNLVNHLLSTNGNVSNPYNCPQLEALSPYITDNNPQIWNLTFTGGLLKFSFNNHGTEFDVSLPNTGQIGDINLINFSSYVTAQSFSTTYINGTILLASHSIRHIDFCPKTECVPLFGEIELDQGISCVSLNVQQSFHLQANQANVVSYSWTFYNNLGNISTTSIEANPVLTYNETGNFLVKLAVTENTGCITTFYKTITVNASCGTSCTETNEDTANVKALYIALLNHLIKKTTIPNGYTCIELTMLSKYITDVTPKIYNPVWNGQVLSFSFSASDSQPDVVIGNYGIIGDINLFTYTNATVNTSPIVTYTNGTVSKTHTVKHINFCPPVNVCESHVAFVIDESASIDSMEAAKIKNQLTKFIEQQLAFGSTTTISFIGMSDSDQNTRTDHVYKKVTLDSKHDFNNWISSYKGAYTPARQAQGISANSDYWASGLRQAMDGYELEPEIIILITDGSQTSNVNELKTLIKNINTNSHLYVYGIGNGYYVNEDQTDIDPNGGAAPVSDVTSRLMTSLKYLMELAPTQFPVSGQIDILSTSYYEYPNFDHLESDTTYFSDRLDYSDIGCGGQMTPKDSCNDCETFQPYPSSQGVPITYWISGWVMEEQNIQVKNYTNAVIHLIFEDGNGLSTDMPFLPSGDIIDGWQRVASKFQIPENTTIMRIELENRSTGIPAYFDDIRIHPINGSMKSFVYDPETFRLMAEHDDNNYTTFYEYDKEGGLVRIKKETSKGIKTIQESRSGSVIQQ